MESEVKDLQERKALLWLGASCLRERFLRRGEEERRDVFKGVFQGGRMKEVPGIFRGIF